MRSALLALARPFGLVGPCSMVLAVGCTSGSVDSVASSTAEIVQGTEVPSGAYPSMASLLSGQALTCGGTLIADDWVLTAAHCLKPYLSDFGVSAVAIGRHRADADGEGELFTIKKVIRHAQFNYFTTENDIALVQLSGRSHAPHARLAKSADVASIVGGATATVIGWGKTSEGGEASDVLRQVSLPIVGTADCRTFPRYENVTEAQICALLPGKGSCQGDSGGPMWLSIDGATTQIGIVSWSVGCAAANAPSVYTNVASYRAWIAEASEGAIPSE